jgi:hypothetical protein
MTKDRLLAYALLVKEELAVERARSALRAAAPEAAEKLIEVMQSGSKDDLVQRQAANDILAINGIAPRRESSSDTKQLVGTAVLAAIAGMAKVVGLKGVNEEQLSRALVQVESDLPRELFTDQESLL